MKMNLKKTKEYTPFHFLKYNFLRKKRVFRLCSKLIMSSPQESLMLTISTNQRD